MSDEMEKPKHTPGPWECVPNPMRESGFFVQTVEKVSDGVRDLDGHIYVRPVAYIVPVQIENEADARLIAAAPELPKLLEACKEVIDVLESAYGFGNKHDDSIETRGAICGSINVLKSAVYKAEGGK